MEKAMDNNDSFNWFSLRVISGKERVVEDTILYESKREKVDDSIEEVFVPFEKGKGRAWLLANNLVIQEKVVSKGSEMFVSWTERQKGKFLSDGG